LKKLLWQNFSRTLIFPKMSVFSSDLLDKIGVPPEYFSEASLHEYFGKESHVRRCPIFETEFDCYSDASVDTSSFSLKSSEYLNWARNVKRNHSLCEGSLGASSIMQYGRSTLTNSESARTSLWSDDDVSEFPTFDQTIGMSPQMVNEEEERQYLSELLCQDIVAAELSGYNPDAMEYSQLNMDRPLYDVQGDFYREPRYLRNYFRENIIPIRDGMQQRNGVEDLYCDTTLVRNHADSIEIPRNPNSRSNDSVKWSKTPVLKEKIQNIKEEKSLDNVVSKKKKKVKPIKSTDDDKQRVFLGGLPIGITERMLRQYLAALGYKVLKRPKILHGFAPEVWMKTVDEAKDLIEKGKIMIEGLVVEVRPYNSWTKLSELKKLPNVGKRSVFIRGLSSGTTTKNLQKVLSEMGMKVINYPVIKNGYARQVILDTISEAKYLINLKKIQVNGSFVDVRPFVNHRRKKRNK